MIKKAINFLYKILGMPYHAVINLLKGVWAGFKLTLKGIKKVY